MSEPFIGQIQPVGFNFAPPGWANCDGQLLDISTNTALFSLLGTIYGGDGETTFQLPDLRGRVPLHVGSGPGIDAVTQGQRGGTNRNTLNTGNLPAHNHPMSLGAQSGAADTSAPAGNVLSVAEDADRNPLNIYSTAAPDVTMRADATGNTGGGTAVNNMQPFLVIRYVIALVGVFPSPS